MDRLTEKAFKGTLEAVRNNTDMIKTISDINRSFLDRIEKLEKAVNTLMEINKIEQ